MEKEVDKAKNVRRVAKSAFTRAINTTQLLLDAKRPPSEIRVHADFIKRHEAYTMILSDEEYPEEEDIGWRNVLSSLFIFLSV